ncbi:aconitate hydratase AcnA [Blastopirellula marina]|uniref:Aconitate hydratase n=1 Tax=Blastopirellula marina TaxID=124 RepID=A0A2S8GLI9_9BACT|nr:aconitate hydratase AcnA [Blastopirellula marina]PQO45201.1 aconitate hydratase AcnA [Blastopirellula marina]
MTAKFDPFGARDVFSTAEGDLGIYRLSKLQDAGLGDIDKLPFSVRVLLESVLRNCDGYIVSEDDVKSLAAWDAKSTEGSELPFLPARVVLQDFTGVPCVVDLAAMRSAMQRLGGDAAKINPLIPVDLVIDHSVQVDSFGTDHALEENVALEFRRNKERYEFLRWGQKSLKNFQAIPPNVGIVHQVNLEYLAKGVFVREDQKGKVALPDSLVGTDSHTTMINGLGVVGWGVGGIEAEAVMLGQPIYMLTPQVVGFELTGKLGPGVTATDMVLTITQILRKQGVVGKFVEFYGPGVSHMSLADRATIANMAPEYGATMGFFPVDAETLNYMTRTGRTAGEVDRVERYTKEQGLFRTDDMAPIYTSVVTLDLSTVEPSLAGPKRPQDRVALKNMKSEFHKSLVSAPNDRGFGLSEDDLPRTATVEDAGNSAEIGHGAVVIAAITSCTNTSNPSVMLASGLVAKKAAEKGLKVHPYVKTSLAPGSRVVTDYLIKADLMKDLEKLGFNLVGYGCTTCIGNSGPLPEPVANAVTKGSLVASAVLSGNRNFEGRVNPHVKANYLASPPLVVAYALAGTVDIDLDNEPLGTGSDGQPVFLKDIWPTNAEIQEMIEKAITPEMFQERYNSAYESNPNWNAISVPDSELYTWDADSTYIQEPPFLDDVKETIDPIEPITGARVLALLGDSVTTDHISPAGAIAKDSPAGKYLMEHGVQPADFNSYGSRRGNDRVMHRGTFANIRIRNRLTPEKEGGWTKCFTNGETMPIFDAAEIYKTEGTPLVVIAGKEYGTGSSRDWAAKGTFMLGVKAVIASSFERIHRSNLIGMGVLPLEFVGEDSWESLGLTGEETYDIYVSDDLKPLQHVTVTAKNAAGEVTTFDTLVRIDTPVELDYYRNGGILQTVLLKLLKESK